MGNIKRNHSSSFKVQVALDLIRGHGKVSEICSRYSIHPTQARRWRDHVLSGLESLFSNRGQAELQQKDKLIEELYKQIGQQKVELDWLKKKSSRI